MYQVLFWIPLGSVLGGPAWMPERIPVYGYGMMLFVAFIICIWLAGKRAEQVGISKVLIQDLAIWLFLGGLIGSRIAYLVEMDREWIRPGSFWDSAWSFVTHLPQIWNGGVIFYGGAIGGIIAYALAYLFVFRKLDISTPRLADVVAPSIAMGLCLGRVGCLLNGCCYGQPATTQWYALHFPLPAPVTNQMVQAGYQTALGFTLAETDSGLAIVGKVEAGSPADHSGVREGDIIRSLQFGREKAESLNYYLARHWPRGENSVRLVVDRLGKTQELGPFTPRALGVQPTQLYESISMVLLCWVLLAYCPFRRHEGEVITILMFGYGLHRLLNEMLRGDKRPEGFEMYTSLVLILVGVGLFLWLRTRPIKRAELNK